MILNIETLLVGILSSLFGWAVSVFEGTYDSDHNAKWSVQTVRNRRRFFRLLASVLLSFLFSLSSLNIQPMIAAVAIVAFWGLSFRKIINPDETSFIYEGDEDAKHNDKADNN